MLIRRALGVILPLCVLSVLLAASVISVANDMYAFVKEDRYVTFNIKEGSSLEEISKTLANNGVINNPNVFCAYVKSKEKEYDVLRFAGVVTLNEAMSYREILLSLI